MTFLPVSCAFAMPTGKTLNARLLNSPAVIRELDKFIFVSPVFRLLIRPHRLRAQHRGARFIAKVRLRAGFEHLNKLASCPPPSSGAASYRLKRIPDRGWKPPSLLEHEMLAMSVVGQKRRFGDVRVTSALPLKADIHRKGRHVSEVPGEDI